MLQVYVPDDWLALHSREPSSTYVIHRVTTAVAERIDPYYSSPKDDLNWTRVLTFIAQEAAELDLRISAALLLVCVLGPALWLLLTRESSHAVGVQVSQHATQTEQPPQEPVTFQYYHYDPAERALLQFGKSRSEPILIGYNMPMNFEDEDYAPGNVENTNKITAGSDLRKEGGPTSKRPSNDTIQAEKQLGQNSVRTQPQDPNADTMVVSPAFSETQEEQSKERGLTNLQPQEKAQCSEPCHRESSSWEDSIVFESLENRLESSGRSSSSLPSLKCTPTDRETSRHSLAHIQLQISPRKTSNVDAQLNPEQAYSQPFTY